MRKNIADGERYHKGTSKVLTRMIQWQADAASAMEDGAEKMEFIVELLQKLRHANVVKNDVNEEVEDIDNKKDRDIIPEVHTIHSHLNHSIGYLILFYYNTQNYYEFNDNTLYLSYLWVYTWLFLIYFPWRYITNDCVYSILDNNTSIIKKVTIFN